MFLNTDTKVQIIIVNTILVYTPNITYTTGDGITPIVVTATNTINLRNGDKIDISGVQGNTIVNGTWNISNVTNTSFEIASVGNGTYAGLGKWLRNADNGYPTISHRFCQIL